jgi:hypothetical protein
MRLSFVRKIAVFLLPVAPLAWTLNGCGGENVHHYVRYDGPMTIKASSHAKDPVEAVAVIFTLRRMPTIEEVWGHAHLGNLSGHDRYNYAGELSFDGREANLKSEFHPIALYKSHGVYYLLGQYWFNPELFECRMLTSDSFEEVGLGGFPPALLATHPVDPRTSALFRLWTVSQLLKSADPSAAAKCFSRYVEENPHFGYEANQERRYTTLPDLLDKVVERKADDFYSPLLSLVNSAKRTDDPQDVGIAALTLKRLRPKEGMDAVQDFIRRVRAEGGNTDPRISDLEWRLKL